MNDLDLNIIINPNLLFNLVIPNENSIPVGRRRRVIIIRKNERAFDILLNRIQTAPNVAQLTDDW